LQLLQLLLVKILIRNARGRRPARDGRGCQFDFSCWIFLTFAFSVINKKPFPVLFFENVEQPRKSIPRRRSRAQRPAARFCLFGAEGRNGAQKAVL
jgi:hypothetical protein